MAVGFAAGNHTTTVIMRALVIMMVGWYAGQAVGAVAHRVIDIQIQEHKERHPLPKLSPLDVSVDEDEEQEEEVGQAQAAATESAQPDPQS